MPIDHFTKEQFEAALPLDNKDKFSSNLPLWYAQGLVEGEYCYIIPVTRPRGVFHHDPKTNEIYCPAIFIRSSVHADGSSALSGLDSIRAWIVRASLTEPYKPWKTSPLGTKVQHHVTRQPGWQLRLTKMLRTLYKLALHIKPCPVCGQLMHAVKIKKGYNAGKFALVCDHGDNKKTKLFHVLEGFKA